MKVAVKKYDVNVQIPPLQFITIDPCIAIEPEIARMCEEDTTGTAHARAFHQLCRERGWSFRFFSMSTDEMALNMK